MAKKSRRKEEDSDDAAGAGVDYLSESHTIVSVQSGAADGTSMEDDPSWGINDDETGENAHSMENALQAAEERQVKFVDAVATTLDFTQEKRSVKREQLLKLWFKAITQYANSTVAEDHQGPLLQCCRHSLRVGTPSEQYAACRVMEALAVLVADESYYNEVQGHLTRMITAAHRAVPVRIAALRALGMAVFMGVEDDQITEAILDLCEQLAQAEYRGDKVPFTLRAAAIEVWTVLATTIHELYVAGKDDVSTGRGLLLLPLLLECLEQSDDMQLRSNAGECVAFIHTARVALGVEETDETLNTTQKQYQQGSWEGSEWEDIISEIEQVMDDLSNQSGHYMSKKAKKEQRANFREYLATIQDNEDPEEVVQFRQGSLELNSWKDIVVLQFVRRCLQGGFQVQLLTNPTLQTIFGLSLQPGTGGLSQLEKRLFVSKTSEAAKLKDVDRTKKRDKRTNVKNHFLTADGDDI